MHESPQAFPFVQILQHFKLCEIRVVRLFPDEVVIPMTPAIINNTNNLLILLMVYLLRNPLESKTHPNIQLAEYS
jgi:hypothetical protein